MMGRTDSAQKLIQRLFGFNSTAVVRLSYLDCTGKLKALFDRRRPALVDIGRKIGQMNATLSFAIVASSMSPDPSVGCGVLGRRRLAALRIGKQLVKSGHFWALDIGPEDTKNRQALDFPVSAKLSARFDVYLDNFRKCIPGAATHNGLWPSNKGRAMDDGTIYDMVRRRTCKAFGFPVNLHRFRHAAMTFWSIQDPKNVRGAKDLLGHATFATGEQHYIMSQSRIAGRVLAQIMDQPPAESS